MQSGRADRKIEIQKNVAPKNSLNQRAEPDWQTITSAPIWAKRIPLNGRRGSERFEKDERVAHAEIAWEVRNTEALAEIDAKHTILDRKGKRHDILHIVEIGRARELRILTKVRQDK